MSFDSVVQYQQAFTGVFTDHHPPLMAWLWSKTNAIQDGPAGMLALHAALMWSGLWLFGEGAAMRGMRAAWLLPLLGFFPPIIGIEGLIWKDVSMAAALLFATGIAYRASAGGARAGWVAATVSLVAIFYAMAVRSNAPAAVGPVLVYWLYCVFPRLSARAAIRAGAVVLVLLLLVQWGVDTRLLHARRDHVSQFLETFDIAAIQCAGGDATIPAAFAHEAPGTTLCDAFDPRVVDKLYAAKVVGESTDRTALRELGRAWRRAIAGSPGKYLAHRWRVFSALLGIDVPDTSRLLWFPYSIARFYGLSFTFTANAITNAIGDGVTYANMANLYSGVVWVLLATAIALIAWRHRRTRGFSIEGALAASALCYLLPYFFVALAPDYRYFYWTIVASSVAALLSVLRGVSRAWPRSQ